ncbi:unnamed protein product [Cylindrotheca closterium]|uniref:Fucolectin tachylectin-4 pentraxin-1 domain-containing protein n=1 Tax=Cylindrotheca closterium TaxID=2856 RepID=A0AAD2FKC6_9STRA|nr:unnamed protein product [Cylindrotheca closterium]
MNRHHQSDELHIEIEDEAEARLSGSSKNTREVPEDSSSTNTNDKLQTSTRSSTGSSSKKREGLKRSSSHSSRGKPSISSRHLSPREDKHHSRNRSSERRRSSSGSRPSRDKHSSSSSRNLATSPSRDKQHGRSGSHQRRSSHRKGSTPSSDARHHSSRRKLKSERDLGHSPRSEQSRDSSHDSRRKSSRPTSYRKGSSRRVLSTSPHRRRRESSRSPSHDRHHDSSRRKSSRPLHEKSSSERKLSKSPQRRSSRRRSSSRKPDSKNISPASILEHQEYPDNSPMSRSWGGSHEKKSRNGDTPYHASISSPPFTNINPNADMLYGTDEDAKAKEKARRGGPERVVNPGVQSIPSNNSVAVSTLYGDDADADAKAKAKPSRGVASLPGIDRVDGVSAAPNWRGTRNSKGSASGATTSTGTVSSGSTKASSAVGTLYGTDADAKAKGKAAKRGGSEFASNPGVDRVHYDESIASTTDTLYGGSDADAKARAKASKNGVSPGFSGRTGSTVPLDASSRSQGLPAAPFEDEEAAPVARKVSIGSTSSSGSSGNEDPERNPLVSSATVNGLQIPNDPEASPSDDGIDKEVGDKERRKSRKRCCFLLVLLLLAGGGAAAWYFLVRNGGSSNENTRSNSSDIRDPSSAPSSSSGTNKLPTEVPLASSSPSTLPSGSPTEEMWYDPPSVSDCELIATNQTIAGREQKENANFGLDLEILLSDNATMTEPLLDELLDAIQEKILPSLAGCAIIVDTFLESWRFVIFDAFVKGNVEPKQPCSDEELLGQDCHRVYAELALFLKGKVRFLDIIRLISDEKDNFSNDLGLSDQFLFVNLFRAEGLTPTVPPTMLPSYTPSLTPSQAPTGKPTPTPTSLPTKAPTISPTGEGSRSPTLVPSLEPSLMPSTGSPSLNPSLQPTGVPTESPSARPTAIISGPTLPPTRNETPPPTLPPTMNQTPPPLPPTLPPSRNQTPPPTDNPTLSPSESPSASPSTSRPSRSPSAPPTAAPSPYPTTSPTKTPSMRPTASPSPPPSPAPSRIPTLAPVYSTQLITQAYGPYTNYPVSQSSTTWGGTAIRAIDGNRSGLYWDGSVTHTNNGRNEWWQVDLATGAGSPVVVDYVTVWNRNERTLGLRLIGAIVQLLDAGQNDITPPAVANTLTGAVDQTINFGFVPGVSFVKISHNNYLTLAEVEVYGYVP